MIRPMPRRILVAISLVQGILLLFLYRAVDSRFLFDLGSGDVSGMRPEWSYPLWTLAIAIPLLLLLSLSRGNERRVIIWSITAAVMLTLTAVYTGRQAEPYGEFSLFSLTFAYAVSIALACFKALMYLQQHSARELFAYRVLFTNSWRNFLIVSLAVVFTVLFWLVLTLWGALFDLIGVGYFSRLFEQDWFVIPSIAVAFGLAITIFRDLTGIIDSITRLLHWLIKLLLPLVIAVAVIFLIALPFVGIGALWQSGRGTALMLWLLAVILFFTNAVYQDGREAEPYSAPVHRAIYGGLCVTPLISALALYGLAARIAQYGWSVERCWAVVAWAFLTLFSIGYVIGIVRHRDAWTRDLAKVNLSMGLVVLAVMLAANSPLLDFRKISLASQLARVERGDIELTEFDYWYTRQNLARPGYLAMQEIRSNADASDRELLALIDNPSRSYLPSTAMTSEEFWDAVTFQPAPFDVPDGVRQLIDQLYLYEFEEPVLTRIDLDDDGRPEYLLLRKTSARLFFSDGDGTWKWAAMRTATGAFPAPDPGRNQIRAIEPRFNDVEVDGIRLTPLLPD